MTATAPAPVRPALEPTRPGQRSRPARPGSFDPGSGDPARIGAPIRGTTVGSPRTGAGRRARERRQALVRPGGAPVQVRSRRPRITSGSVGAGPAGVLVGTLVGRLVAAAVVVFAVVVLVVTAVAGWTSPHTRDVTAVPGDSVWSIAARVHPVGDLTDTVARIRSLNALPGDAVPAGARLRVPDA